MRSAIFARAALGTTPSPAQVTAALSPLHRPFLLHGRWGGDTAGSEGDLPVLVAGAEPVRELGRGEDPFAALTELPVVEGDSPAGAIGGGIVGWFGFECAALAERGAGSWPPRAPGIAAGRPAQLAWYDNVLRRDAAGVWWVEALLAAGSGNTIDQVAERWRARLDAAPPPQHGSLGPLTLHRGRAAHRAAVAETIERIGAGELFQANICLRLDGEVEGARAGLVAPVLEQTAPWYGAWIEGAGDRALLSASPELFLRRTGRSVETGPIKGTAARAAGVADPHTDPAATGLLASAKDRAEHVMIVDLMRNDLGRVCDYGTVIADARPTVEPHAGVWHLTSTVRGELHPSIDDAALLRASFPPGSVTGAPKVQAMRVIAALEGSAREAYTGAHGLVSPVSGLELAVTIRTLEFAGDHAWLGAGGGIVSDSDPGRELGEAIRKAGGIASAAGSTVESAGDSRGVPREDAGDAPAGVPWVRSADRRPDPRKGLLETIRVGTDGVPVRLGQHLARLADSLRVTGLGELPADADARVADFAAALPPAAEPRRLRVIAHPAAGPRGRVALELGHAPLGEAGSVVDLEPVIVPGGLGAHKWADRELADTLTERLGATPLLLDADGTLLEAAWATIWWLDDGVLCTPPLDGRRLPGVTRGAVLEHAAGLGIESAQRELRLSGAAANRPLLLSSARGVSIGRLSATTPRALDQAARLASRLAGV